MADPKKFQLKLNTAVPSQPPSTVSQTAHPTGLRLNFTPKASSATDKAPKSAFPTGTARKRTQHESDPTASASATKKPKAIIRINSPAHTQRPAQLLRKGSVIKLKKSNTADQTPTTPGGGFRPALKLKHRGKIPPRPHGVGYDSECSDAEEDPTIEENFVLRMLPGEDAEAIRRAIDEKKIGVPIKDGGADVSLKFFTRDARRACIRVQDRFYGAVLVDLPCVIETMKSWDKKGWWKAADVCQMLVVTGRVENEDKARTVDLPKEVDQKTWAWPHGLTPPMHDVKRRRFRKRVSHRTIEQAEEEVERLLRADALAGDRGGTSEVTSMTWEDFRRQEDGPDDEEPVEALDAEGDFDDEDDEEGEQEGPGEAAEEDEDDLMAQFEAQLGEDEPDTPSAPPPFVMPPPPAAVPPKTEYPRLPPVDLNAAFADADTADADTTEVEVDVEADPADADAAAGSGSGSGSDEDDNDEDEASSEEEEDDDAREKREERAQQMEEIAHIEEQIAEKKRQLALTTNPLFRQRLLTTIQKFEEDRDVKKRGAGVTLEDEDDDGDE